MSTPFEDGVIHASDCAVHRSPAYPAGECDCQDTAECLKSGVCLDQLEQPTLDVESTLEMYRNAEEPSTTTYECTVACGGPAQTFQQRFPKHSQDIAKEIRARGNT